MRLTSCTAVFLMVLASTALAIQSHVGLTRGPGPSPDCAVALGPAEGELFVFDLGGGGVATHLEGCINGVRDRIGLDWDERTGAWEVVDHGSERVLAVATHYPTGLSGHHGFVVLGEDDTLDGSAQARLAQRVPQLAVAGISGGCRVRWPPLVTSGTSGACVLGAPGIVIGYDLYRLPQAGAPAGGWTPDAYLCGPDLSCASTADNGWVAFIDATPGADGLLFYTDRAVARPSEASWVVQPVIVRATTRTWGAADDLDADAIPEFVDPSGRGLGLTGRVATGASTFAKPILVGIDSLTDVSIRVPKQAGRAIHVTWARATGAVAHDLYEGALSDLRNPVRFAARTVLACNLPPGPGDFPLTAPVAGNRYYLMTSVGESAVEYGVDSFGRERPATTTLPPCR